MFNDDFEYDYYEPQDLVDLLAEGDGRFILTTCIPKTSKSGNAMLALEFDVMDSANKTLVCRDWIVKGDDESSKKRCATKVRNIANAIGKPELYAAGYKLKPRDLVGGRGDCVIKTQKGDDQFPPKSVIAKFVPVPKVNKETGEIVDDELPWA